MRNRQTHARRSVLYALGWFAVLQAGLVLLLLQLPWLRDPYYGYKVSHLQERIAPALDRPLTVVMLGSSRTAYGLDGTLMEPILSREQGRPVVVFNLGMWGAGPVINLMNVRRLLDDGVRPDLLLLEVIPSFLSQEAPRYDLAPETLPTPTLRRHELAVVQRYTMNYRKVHRRDWWLGWLVPAYHHRFALVSYLVPQLLSGHDRLDTFTSMNRSGWVAPFWRQISAAQRAHNTQKALDEHVRYLKNFHLGGFGPFALRETLELCRAEKVPTALVLMPEGPRFRSLYSAEARKQIQRFLDETSREFGVALIDGRNWIDSEEEFADSHHLLPDGAAHFSRRLGQEALSPLLRELTARRISSDNRRAAAP